MKALSYLLSSINSLQIIGKEDVMISSLHLDSREVSLGALFFAQKGTLTDGHQFIPIAIEKGAIAIVCEIMPEAINENVTYVQVEDTAIVMGCVAAAFYDFPSEKLKVVGVTGTNGKTTIATLLFKLFSQLNYKTGLISTVQNQIAEEIIPSSHTTPDAISLQKLFSQMVAAKCSHVFMEVSSHAIHQHRVAGVQFDGGIFSNITHDHLDYHKTFDEYIKVKKSFFDHLPSHAFALSNKDDKRGEVMLQNTKADKHYYSLRSLASFKGQILSNDLTGLQMMVNGHEVHFRLIGLFNAYNLLAVYGAAMLMEEDSVEVLSVLSNMQGAAGRFETYRSQHQAILGIVDYAHTPDALKNVLATIKQFDHSGQIITVVGCGGNRDKTKRPVMAEVACEYSDRVILTSDNPRDEDPETILNDMEAGVSSSHKRKTLRITDRKEAIKTACSLANDKDIILIAGKGHETYQEVKGVKHHFDDKEVLLEMYELLEK